MDASTAAATETSDGSTSADDASSGPGPTSATGEPGEPISLFELACGEDAFWVVTADFEVGADMNLECGDPGVLGSRVEKIDELQFGDGDNAVILERVVVVAPPRAAAGEVFGTIFDLDISGLVQPTVRASVRCIEDEDCSIDWTVSVFENNNDARDAPFAAATGRIGPDSPASVDLDLGSGGVGGDNVDVQFSFSAATGELMNAEQGVLVVDPRIE